jgi:hypothetical protein
MKKSLQQRIAEAIRLVESARKSKQPFGLLGDISKLLLQMQDCVDTEADCRGKLAAGLGRLVTDDYKFSESSLGSRLLELADDFAPVSK